jgi:hypothetical protein
MLARDTSNAVNSTYCILNKNGVVETSFADTPDDVQHVLLHSDRLRYEGELLFVRRYLNHADHWVEEADPGE